jgi:hypothetical protein
MWLIRWAIMLVSRMKREQAEVTAIKVLQFIVEDRERVARFLGITGMEPADLRSSAGNATFLAGVVDYVLDHETLLLEFCAREGLRPEIIWGVRRALPGGQSDF